MKHNKIILLTVSVLLLLGIIIGLAYCSRSGETGTDSVSDSSAGEPSGEAEPDAAKAPDYRVDAFDDALISYLSLNGYDSADFLVSPEAFRASLCLAAAGAQGNTRTELLQAAGFSGMEALNSWYAGLDDAAAASVWSSETQLGTFSDAYTSKLKEYYHADACSRSAEELTQAISDWTAQKTDGAISAAAEDISGASAVLVSTMRLEAAWKETFSGAALQEGVFVGSDGNAHDMDFMEQTGEYLYASANGTEIVAIPMEHDLSFVCFLGNQTGRFDALKNVRKQKVRVVLPEFVLASRFDVRDLSGFLLERGVSDALNSQTANFYQMCSEGDWFMQEILQNVRISAGKGGLSASPGEMTANSASGADESSAVKTLVADSPFSFAVFSGFGTEQQSMLLYGQVVNGG